MSDPENRERPRTELLKARGFDLARFAEESRILFMVHEIAVRYITEAPSGKRPMKAQP